ncbi:MAG: hypothetical protein ACRBK7_06720 [Acidimicrobiales bacterium]
MDLEYGFVLGDDDKRCALVGETLYRATSLSPLLIWDGLRQLHETDLMYSAEKRTRADGPGCIAVAVLAPFEVTSADVGTLCRAPSPHVTQVLGYFQARLPTSHIFVIRDEAVSDYWLDPEIQVTSLQDPTWRQVLVRGVAEIGVDVDLDKVADLDV